MCAWVHSIEAKKKKKMKKVATKKQSAEENLRNQRHAQQFGQISNFPILPQNTSQFTILYREKEAQNIMQCKSFASIRNCEKMQAKITNSMDK